MAVFIQIRFTQTLYREMQPVFLSLSMCQEVILLSEQNQALEMSMPTGDTEDNKD